MYDSKSRIDKAKKIRSVLEHYLGKKNLDELRVMDIGCSTGIIDDYLSNFFKSLTGIDIDNKAIEYSKRNFEKTNLKFEIGDGLNLKFNDNSFDLVICTQTYEHVSSSKKLFSEIYRVLKKGGICYLTAMNKLWPLEPHYKIPFLSWLPKRIVPFYLESPKTYWQLRKEVSKFHLTDYTEKILTNPKKFNYNIVRLPEIIANNLKFFTPSFVWILEKNK